MNFGEAFDDNYVVNVGDNYHSEYKNLNVKNNNGKTKANGKRVNAKHYNVSMNKSKANGKKSNRNETKATVISRNV